MLTRPQAGLQPKQGRFTHMLPQYRTHTTDVQAQNVPAEVIVDWKSQAHRGALSATRGNDARTHPYARLIS